MPAKICRSPSSPTSRRNFSSLSAPGDQVGARAPWPRADRCAGTHRWKSSVALGRAAATAARRLPSCRRRRRAAAAADADVAGCLGADFGFDQARHGFRIQAGGEWLVGQDGRSPAGAALRSPSAKRGSWKNRCASRRHVGQHRLQVDHQHAEADSAPECTRPAPRRTGPAAWRGPRACESRCIDWRDRRAP